MLAFVLMHVSGNDVEERMSVACKVVMVCAKYIGHLSRRALLHEI